MKLDILAFSAHPDDIELSCAGTLINHIQQGYKVGIIDLTQGELGTRGSAAIRLEEATAAAEIMGLSVRENLKMKDGFFDLSEGNKLKVVEAIRKYQPDIVLANAIRDRHPDHGRGGQLVSEACFLAGLVKVVTSINGENQTPWRPKRVYHYIQDNYIEPDFVVDITDSMDTKTKAIKAYKTQFWDPKSSEPKTPISGEDFILFLEARARQFGRSIQTTFAEGFTTEQPIPIKDITKH